MTWSIGRRSRYLTSLMLMTVTLCTKTALQENIASFAHGFAVDATVPSLFLQPSGGTT